MDQPAVGKACHTEKAMMQEWAKTYGASIRQRRVRQETTMARTSTLLDYLYQKDVHANEKIVLTSDAPTVDPVTITDADAEDSSTPDPVETDSGEPEEYDSSSDDETAEEIDNPGNTFLGHELSRDVDF